MKKEFYSRAGLMLSINSPLLFTSIRMGGGGDLIIRNGEYKR